MLACTPSQACYWFSNGCTVGCAACDGSSNHVGHGRQRFLYNGMSAAARAVQSGRRISGSSAM